MKNIFSYYSKTGVFSLVCIGLITVLYIFPEYRNHNLIMVDYEVFYKAAQHIFAGSELYQIEEDGHFVFKYSPTSSIYFIPFIVFPFSISKIIYWLFLCALMVTGAFLAGKLYLSDVYRSNPRKYNNVILLSILAVGVHIQRELTLGQVNWVLLVFYLWIASSYINNKTLQISLGLAISIFIKPFGLIFLPYLIWKRKTKTLSYFILFSIVLLLLPLLFYSFMEYQNLLIEWMNELTTELGNKQDIAAPRVHTIFSLLIRYTPLYFFSFSSLGTLVYQVIVVLLIGLAIIWFVRIGKGLKFAEAENFALLIALIPLIASTSEDAFLFLFPAILINFRDINLMNRFEKIIFITGLVFQGANIWEIWGPNLTEIFLDLSVVAIGAVLIIAIMFRLRYKKMKGAVSV